jgi:hypothetical protein
MTRFDDTEILERRRRSSSGLSRASAALLLDKDAGAAADHLLAEAAVLRGYLEASLPAGPAGARLSACEALISAACEVLARAPAERDLQVYLAALGPPWSDNVFEGCAAGPREVALAALAFLLDDEPVSARHLTHRRRGAESAADSLLAEVVSLLVRRRGAEVPDALARLAPEYERAMQRGLWRTQPARFLFVELLAVLRVASERGSLDLASLPDVLRYAPVWFLR